MKDLEEKMSYRIIKVLRIFAYIFVAGVWIIGLFKWRGYNYETGAYMWDITGALGWTVFFNLIATIIVEGLYQAFLYILFGKKK